MSWMWLLVWGLAMADPGEGATVEADARGALVDAQTALDEGRLDQAARAFEAVAAVSEDPAVHLAAALARYEGGWPRRALQHVERALALSPEDPAALSLGALVLADLGRGAEASRLLDRADAALATKPNSEISSRVAQNRALVDEDRGVVASREAALGEALRAGRLGDARALVDAAPAKGRREQVRALVARAAVERAEGALAPATASAWEALGLAREAGMVREAAHALLSLATTAGMRGDAVGGQALAEEALGLLEGTHFAVLRVSAELEAGRLAARAGRLEAAEAHQTAARAALPLSSSIPLDARESELRGLIAALKGHMEPAREALSAALARYDALGYRADGARVATARVEAEAFDGTKRQLGLARSDALGRFEALADPLGPAHVGLAEGLGFARARRLDDALDAFARAAKAAEGVEGGKAVAAIAREDAAQALLALGDEASAEAADLESAVAAHHELVGARTAYAEGMASYERGDYVGARERFDQALGAFLTLGDLESARLARTGRAWAVWNVTVALEPAESLPIYTELASEAREVGASELETRALAAALLARAKLGEPASLERLEAVSLRAESEGLSSVAAQCLAEIAERHPDLRRRAVAARSAAALDSSAGVGGYALYGVAVAAYNADEYELAIALSREALPLAGTLESAVREVLEAATAAQE